MKIDNFFAELKRRNVPLRGDPGFEKFVASLAAKLTSGDRK
jgi:hypothetical protein